MAVASAAGVINSKGHSAYVHELKCWAENFDAILAQTKRCEARSEDDRKFKAGDVVDLIRCDRTGKIDEPRIHIIAEITHVERFAGPVGLVGLNLDDGTGPLEWKPVPIAVLSLSQRMLKMTVEPQAAAPAEVK